MSGGGDIYYDYAPLNDFFSFYLRVMHSQNIFTKTVGK